MCSARLSLCVVKWVFLFNSKSAQLMFKRNEPICTLHTER